MLSAGLDCSTDIVNSSRREQQENRRRRREKQSGSNYSVADFADAAETARMNSIDAKQNFRARASALSAVLLLFSV